ncbi:MAG TPA: LLM class F420-dependent oxidoreductase [Acidimicrobiales bacterium]|nr:LLM class F420-dependent oxidoreductase [Acidimicrobiales bacterium]
MRRFRVGVQLHPQVEDLDDLRHAARDADALGVDSIWVWDHFFPLYGNPDGPHFEAYTLLAALAADTERARLGALVTCNSYRNPQLLADMARTIDHLSHGRFTLGIGAGWFERDYTEYGYEFGTAIGRLRALERDLPTIRQRLEALTPAPLGPLPILVGGAGEKVTLRIVAQHADAWNAFGPPEAYAHKNEVLDRHCAEVGRDPAAIERTVALQPSEVDDAEAFVAAGATHLIVMVGRPFDLSPVAALLAASGGDRAGAG